ncbi:MAG: peptide ABC transporter substrate-binding protein [Candidatus Dormibacteraceae bacterium]
MRHNSFARSLAVMALMGLATAACASGGGSSSSGGLASDQTLRFPIIDDVSTLDPAHVILPTDVTISANIFDGLMKFDKDLKLVTDIATAPPTVSSDALTYTFTLRKDVKFSNGDPVTAQDFIYSWTRTAAANDSYSGVFDAVEGFDALTASPPTGTALTGLSAPDPYTLVIHLTRPEGYFLTELGQWAAVVIDQKVVKALGEDTWWTTPAGLVGTGPFKMTQRTPKASMDFTAVPNWWGGSTGSLKNVHIEIVKDQTSQVKKYESGGFDDVGSAYNYPDINDMLRYKADPTLSSQLTVKPFARTFWIAFNFKNGPFAGLDSGKLGRAAFSLSIDRAQLVDIACGHGLQCDPATGGVITKGLQGYLGDGADPNAKFDPTTAKADLKQWDPTGSKTANLVFFYSTDQRLQAIAENLQSQWKANLGINVQLQSTDFPTFNKEVRQQTFAMFKQSWTADYDHPQDWFDYLFSCSNARPGTTNAAAVCDPRIDALVKQADVQSLTDGLPSYVQAGKYLVDDVAVAPLIYDKRPFITKPYVRGVGANALYDYPWTGVSILSH